MPSEKKGERPDDTRGKDYAEPSVGGLTRCELNSDPEVTLGGADAVPDSPHSAGGRGADVNQPGEQPAGQRKGERKRDER